MLQREAAGGGAGGDVEFGVDRCQMPADGAGAEEEALGDLGIGQAGRDEAEHLDLAGGEAGRIGRAAKARVAARASARASVGGAPSAADGARLVERVARGVAVARRDVQLAEARSVRARGKGAAHASARASADAK